MTSGGSNTYQLAPTQKKSEITAERDEIGSEKDGLVNTEKKDVTEKDVQYRKVAIVISTVSVVTTFIMGILALVFGISSGSVATFGFACGAVLDSLSSIVVIWRYWGNSSTIYSWNRERKACICLGGLFIVITIVIFTRSIIALVLVDKPQDDFSLWCLSLINGLVCTLLAIIKYWMGTKIHSSAVKTDAFNSLINAVMAYAILISVTVYTTNDEVWFLDPIVGMCCAMFFLIYGVRLLMDYVPYESAIQSIHGFQ